MANSGLLDHLGQAFMDSDEELSIGEHSSDTEHQPDRGPEELESLSDADDENPPHDHIDNLEAKNDANIVASANAAEDETVATTEPMLDQGTIDARIDELSYQQQSRGAIACILKAEYNITWSSDAIGRRHRAYLAAKRQLHDAELDIALRGWRSEEDVELKKCVSLAEEELAAQIQKLKDKFWHGVSDRILDHNKLRLRSARACKERHEAILQGTACPAYEEDHDQEQRAAFTRHERARFTEARDAILKAQEAEKQARTQEHRDARQRRDQAIRDKQQLAEQRHAAKIRKAKHVKLMLDLQDKEDDLLQWIVRRRRIEDRILARLGDPVHKGNETGRKRKCQGLRDGEASTKQKTLPRRAKMAGSLEVTKDTLENPRSIMSMSELEVLMVRRGLQRSANDDHAQVVARLVMFDSRSSISHINSLLGERFLKLSGSKTEKIHRLQKHDADRSSQGEAGVTAMDARFKEGYNMYSRHGIALRATESSTETSAEDYRVLTSKNIY